MKSSTRRNPTMILRRTITGEPSDISCSGRVFSDIGVEPELLTHFPQSTQLFSHLILSAWCDDEVDHYPVSRNNKIWQGIHAWHHIFCRNAPDIVGKIRCQGTIPNFGSQHQILTITVIIIPSISSRKTGSEIPYAIEYPCTAGSTIAAKTLAIIKNRMKNRISELSMMMFFLRFPGTENF